MNALRLFLLITFWPIFLGNLLASVLSAFGGNWRNSALFFLFATYLFYRYRSLRKEKA